MSDQHSPTSKRDLLDRMASDRRVLDGLIAGVPRDRFAESTRWGSWTLKDLVAHIAAYERWTAEQLERPNPSEAEIERTTEQASEGTDALNEMIYRQHKDDPLDAVLAESRAAHEALRAAIESLTDEQLAGSAWWTEGHSLLSAIPSESNAHYYDHVGTLQEAVDEPVRMRGA
jgi:uncharacterized protein (TIGR03083 family)